MADWCALPGSAVALIARRLQVIEDFIAFRATCPSWRQATTLKDFYTFSSSSCRKLPLLMLRQFEMYNDEHEYSVEIFDERNQRIDPDEERKLLSSLLSAERKLASDFKRNHPAYVREFMSLSKGKTCKFSFPEAKGMECIGSKGWFIMIERRSGNMCLFHPLTRVHIPLPKPNVKFPIWPKEIRSAVLSASPSDTSDYIVMVAYVEPPYISGRYVGYWKPGNQTWTRIEIPIPHCVEDLNYYNGKFYALTLVSQVWMLDVSGPNPNNKASLITELPWKRSRPDAQLVECGGRLLIVAPFFCLHYDMASKHDLEMVEIDVIKGSYITIASLGSSAVFLGRNEGFSIDANKFPGIIKPNSIYFGDGSSKVATPGPNHISEPTFGHGVWVNF